jgi:holin-like protein
MLYAGLALVVFQYLGDLIAAAIDLPVPGVVVGLLLFLTTLALRGWWLGSHGAVPDPLNRVAKGLHDHFGLLFVPAGVGIIGNLDRLAADGLALFAVVLFSTVTTITVTALIAVGRPGPVPVPAGRAPAEQP